MKISDQAEADRFFEELVKHSISFGKTRAEAEAVERLNLGYYAGYYDIDTRLRVERLFLCAHPVFGKAANRTPTATEAISSGMALANNE